MKAVSSLRMPEAIFYGEGAFAKVGEEAAQRGSRALIISDAIMQKLGYVDLCKEHLARQSVDAILYLDVATEPTDLYVAQALKIFEEHHCNVIISLGGGSCIDTAKAVSIVATNGGYIGDYMGAKKVVTAPVVPHIAIPTTAGTGSEATDVTVITNTADDIKMMIKQPAFLPAVAIVDPVLTMSSPKSVTAATGIDALSHAIEAYLSKKSHPMTDMLALSAMELIIYNIRTAFFQPNDLKARGAMALGAMQAGIAFSNASVCLVHGMSRPIGALFHVPHGISNAMLLPAVLEFSQEYCEERLAALGKLFVTGKNDLSTKESSVYAVEQVKKLCLDLEIPNLKGWGINDTDFALAIDKMATDALASGSPANNPRVPTKEEITGLYQTCFDYSYEPIKPVK